MKLISYYEDPNDYQDPMVTNKDFQLPFSLELPDHSCSCLGEVFIFYFPRTTFEPCHLTDLNKISFPRMYYFNYHMAKDFGTGHSWSLVASILCCSTHANLSMGWKVNLTLSCYYLSVSTYLQSPIIAFIILIIFELFLK